MKIRVLCMIVILCMLIGSLTVPVWAEETDESVPYDSSVIISDETADDAMMAVKPTAVVSAMNTFGKALKNLTKNSAKMSALETVLTRFAGVAGFVSGGAAVLKLMGVTEDPTKRALAEILTEVKYVQEMLYAMDTKLDSVSKELTELAASVEEKDRQTRARDLLSYWRTFNTSYIEPLANKLTEYQGFITRGLAEWWGQEEHDGVWLLYTSTDEGIVETFSKSDYEAGIPDQADNGEAILKSACIGIPAEYIPATSTVAFDVNTYKDQFRTMAAESFIAAANEKKLEASEEFYTEWEGLNESGKNEKAQSYAQALLNTVTTRVACKVMSENDAWVISLINAFNNFCTNLRAKDSGVDALVNVQYLTHGFEGEVKQEIEEIFDGMVATVGFYGSFAVSAAGQDSFQAVTARENLRDNWINTILFLDQKRSTAFTGYDNYCYIAGALINYMPLLVSSEITSKFKYVGLLNRPMEYYQENPSYDDIPQRFLETGVAATHQSAKATPWTLTDLNGKKTEMPTILNSKWALVLFHQSQQQKDSSSFEYFLHRNGTGVPENFRGYFTTSYKGAQRLPLSDGLEMDLHYVYGNTFLSDLAKGNRKKTVSSGLKIKDKYYIVRDKVIYDYIDADTGKLNVNRVCAARALYQEDHWFWIHDEMSLFTAGDSLKPGMTAGIEPYSESNSNSTGSNLITKTTKMTAQIYVLTVTPYRNAAGEGDEEIPSALYAFEWASYMEVPNEEAGQPEKKDADWDSISEDTKELYSSDDEKMEDGIRNEIDRAVQRAKTEGLNVILSDDEKETLTGQMKERLLTLQEELNTNTSIFYLDVFGIGNDEGTKKALAKEVLSLEEDKTDMMDAAYINTAANYEPGVILHFVRKNGKIYAQICPAFHITPLLAVWDPYLGEDQLYDISNESMAALNLKMNVRIPVSFAKNPKAVLINHYDDYYDMNRLESFNLSAQGSGNDQYVEAVVSSVSPFEVASEAQDLIEIKSKAVVPETGDSSGSMAGILMILMFAAIGIAAAGITMFNRKKVKTK